MWRTPLVAAALLASAGCSREPKDQPAASAVRQAEVPAQAELDRLAAERAEPLVRRLAVSDYYLHYHLMQATGIAEALGGEEQAIAALKAVGEAHERNMRWGEQAAPKLIPAQFTGEGMSAGMYGFGAGAVGGFLSGSILREMFGSSLSDEQFSRMVKDMEQNGPAKITDRNSSLELQVGDDGRFDQTIESDVEENGVKGKLKVKIHIDGCPDPQGKMTITFDIDSQMSVAGQTGTGGYVRAQYKRSAWLDDDAHLIETADGRESSLHLEMGGFENYRGQHVVIDSGVSRGGTSTFDYDTTNFSIFRPGEIERAQGHYEDIAKSLDALTELMLRGLKNPPWESGRCVDLQVTSDPEERTGQRPNTAYDIEAKPRATADGLPTGGAVRATLSGESSLNPSGSKVEADAKFEYANPRERDKTASIYFEARSKRGVGKASLAFDTKKKSYVIGGCQLSGRVPDVNGPFDASVSGYNFHFAPSGEMAGRWTWSISGARGEGPYHITLDEDGTTGTLTLPPGANVIGGTTMTTAAWTCTLTAEKN